MDSKLIFLLLALLVNVISARPEPEEYDEFSNPCELFFAEAGTSVGTLTITQQEKDKHLTYECVEANRCKDNRNENGVVPFGSGPSLTDLINAAQTAKCTEEGEICCAKQHVANPEKENKCSDDPGYSCVTKLNCQGDVNDGQNGEVGSCYDVDAPIRNVEKTCCKNIINPPKKCSVLAGHKYRCVAKTDCKGHAPNSKRSVGFEQCLDPATVADDATCPSESEICCHEENIERPCSDYSPDGYQCSEMCFDLPQDEPSKDDRKSNIEFYMPKQAKCLKKEVCCKRTEKIETLHLHGATKCEEWGPGYQCTTLEQCEPDSFAVKDNEVVDSTLDNTVSLLFGEGDSVDLFAQNSDVGFAVNPDLVPCEFPQLVCCKPSEEPIAEEASTRSQSLSVKKCGIHNANGIVQNGVATITAGVSSQEGEWPHTCIIFNNGNIIGGASLIASKVLITAAHLLQSEETGTLSASDLKIRCGEYDLTSSTVERLEHQERNVKTFTIHPYYSGSETLRNDLAIIHTTDEFLLAPNVNPICLPKTDIPFSAFICSSMGWGVNSELDNVIGQNIMKQVTLNRITNRTQCEKAIKATGDVKFNWSLDDSWICANLEVNDKNVLCDGDGGGALVCEEQGTGRNVLAGVIAFGIGCGKKDVPEIFASVQEALCFIDYDVKCKHGNEFISDFDYAKECSAWYDEQVEFLEKNKAVSFIRKYLKNIKSIEAGCVKPEKPKVHTIDISICPP